ncbi:hypothetical protein Poli38472_011456 [Pythium oligandrum]|uniref:1-phosphatidylinositol 4-kinase n=1 Tax=Pythium oligandrum TaxID=41045 RepID=A0A8K1FJ62_PYTOL|nr:hypothetical protein Poli38472_011456 [Pythium oligandrum]|eukprot:TMW64576.1 hypothetical protein Poli38472_011456 [Pythium oligandrum]
MAPGTRRRMTHPILPGTASPENASDAEKLWVAGEFNFSSDESMDDDDTLAQKLQDLATSASPPMIPLNEDSLDDVGSSKQSTRGPEKELDEEEVALEGFLRKRYSSSLYMGSWRYCVLNGTRLRWYMTSELAQQDIQIRGEVWITSVEPWTGQGSMNLYPNAFAMRTSTNRVLLCSAKTPEDKEQWVQSLKKSVSLEKQAHPHLDGFSLGHGHDAERRRIVPEDAVRAAAMSDASSLPGSMPPPAATTNEGHDDKYPLGHSQLSAKSTSSESVTSGSGSTAMECTECGVRFGTFRSRRVFCGSCEQPFCSRHCFQYIKLHHLNTKTTRRCCGGCVRRQGFLIYLGTVSDFMKTAMGSPLGVRSLTDRSKDIGSKFKNDNELYERSVHKLRYGPMSFIRTVKILYQTRQNPHMFSIACERLPFYVENCIDRVENMWYQILHLFQCCDSEMNSFSVQLFVLKRYIGAICRRSPRIALQTIWHVQASMEDSTRHHPNSLMSLLGFLYPPNADSKVWSELLLADCPAHQRMLILKGMRLVHRQFEEIVAKQKESMIERWLSARNVYEFESSAMELNDSGIALCEFQSSIQYDSLRLDVPSGISLEEIVADQVRFVQSLADISERLRHVQPVEDRKKYLGGELEELNENLISSALYPLCAASDELYKVVRIPPNEGKVFSTKMRAPTLIFIEAVPMDSASLLGTEHERLLPFTYSSRRGTLTILEALNSEPRDGNRDSLSSSAESSTETATAATPNRRRHGSQLSSGDDLDNSSGTDEEPATPSNQSTPVARALNRHMTLPGTSMPERGGSVHARPSHGFSFDSHNNQSHHHVMDNIVYDSKVYGESWDDCQERIRLQSPHGHLPGWQLYSVIVKTNDDLRQEVFTMQLINKFKLIFEVEQLNLWLRTYRIVATGASIGLLETINDACSLDHLKKNFSGGNLFDYFRATYGEPQTPGFEIARRNFIRSLAAYSILSYVLLVKDRHNGNILLSSEGHIIHIDFGFILGIAPGGMFSLEDAPFKLTEEMIEIVGGLDSAGFGMYRKMMCDGFMALQRYQSEIAALVQTTGQHSPFPCFEGVKLTRAVTDLRGRLCVGLTRQQVEKRVDYLIKKSYKAWGTRQYDTFQLRSNNIHP